ncbi:MAG: P-loop NTPase fold protein, partial [Psychrobacillus psychrodurans]
MSELNGILNHFLNKTFESLLHIVKITSNSFIEVIKNYNSLIMILVFLVLIGIFVKDKIDKKRSTVFTNIKIINLFSHIGLACILGYLFKIANINKINQLLVMYWSIRYFLYCFIIILLIKELVIYVKSTNKITENFSRIYYYLGLTYIFTAIAINQLAIINDLLLILIFIFGWSVFQLLSRESLSNNSDKVDDESDVEIKSYKQLMPTRQHELKKIITLLMGNNYNEPFALLLNGNWGEGKTSLVNVLSKKLKADGNFNIFIQPLILDTTEKLIEYFFSQLEDILKSNGIYTGKDSPFKKYINIIFQSINTLNLKQVIKFDEFLSNLDNKEHTDFRRTKEILENDIQRLLDSKSKKSLNDDEDLSDLTKYVVNNKKIFIIVDDFDRVEEETF